MFLINRNDIIKPKHNNNLNNTKLLFQRNLSARRLIRTTRRDETINLGKIVSFMIRNKLFLIFIFMTYLKWRMYEALNIFMEAIKYISNWEKKEL